MATKTHRLLTNLERPLFERVEHLAERDGVSLSQKVRDLIRDAVELDEDADLAALVMERKKRGEKIIPHAEFWKKAGVK